MQQNGGNNVGGGGDGTEPAYHDAQRPIVRAVPSGEGFGGQRGISEPADIRGAARAAQSFTADIAEVEQQPAKRA